MNFRIIGAAAGALLAAAMFAAPVKAAPLTGAGSTFIEPIMQHWIAAYKAKTGVDINYQPIGSGGGINALISQTVDFAGSDVPMNANEEAQAKGPVLHIPDIVGAVVVAYNIPGIGPGIGLSGRVIADIYLGKIKYWDDPAIVRLSPGTKFPHHEIIVNHRSDGSGTSYIFTEFLSKVSPEWKSGPGIGKSIDWPTGIGGKGNAGVAGNLAEKPYSIGYLELAYAVTNKISYAQVQNSAGKMVYPYLPAVAAAANGIEVPANLEVSATNSPNRKSYPIAGFSYLIIYKNPSNPAVKDFVRWVITSGQAKSFTEPLSYAPISATIRAKALKALAQ